MSRAASARSSTAGRSPLLRRLQDYFWRSELPLTILLFLTPMLILYELGTAWYISDWARQSETRVLAFNLMRQFMGLFGATGRYLPALAVIGILLAWHIARRDPWRLQFGTASLMAIESALLAIPLLAASTLLATRLPLHAPSPALPAGIVLALGAGIYEELVFRLAAFTLLNILLIDLLRIPRRSALILIILSTSVLFAAYHHWSPQSSPFNLADFIFRTAAGGYFALLFVARGFGITAGAHAAYDIYYFTLAAVAISR